MADHNIIRHEILPPKAKFTEFPGMRWDPVTGEGKVYEKAEDVPEGHLNYHPHGDSAPPKKADAKPAAGDALNLTKDEVKAALKAGKIEFKANAGHKALYDLLVTSVKAELVKAEIEHDAASTDAKALLELLLKE